MRMVQVPKKKLKKKSLKIVYSTCKDLTLTYILNHLHINPTIYSLITFNPVELAITSAIIKLGLPKVLSLLILAFLA